MGNITNAFNAAFPDGPVNSPTKPYKPVVRQIGPTIEADLRAIASGIVAGGAILYQTRAALYADLARPANTLGMVWGDSNPAYNGFYVKYGTSGTGGWTATGVGVPSTVSAQIADLQAAVLALENGYLGKAAADIPSANQVDITNIAGDYVQVTGSQTIQYFTAARIGLERSFVFMAPLILKHSDFIRLPGNADISVQAGDRAIFRCAADNRWSCIVYQRGNGKPFVMPDAADIPGLSSLITEVTALRDQTVTAAAAASLSAANADTSADLAVESYNDILSTVNSSTQIKIDTLADGILDKFPLSSPVPAVLGHLYIDLHLDGHIRPKDGVVYTIVDDGESVQFPEVPPIGTHIYGEGAVVLASGPISGVFPSIRNKGGTEGENNTVPANASLADEGEVYLPNGDWMVDDTFENRLGGRIYGPGRLLLPTQKGSRQLNSDADAGHYILGMEYASAYCKALMADSPVTMAISGDSTVEVGEFETFIPIMARDNGIRDVSVYIRGYSGHTLAWWLANRMGVDINDPEYGVPNAYVHRWGINDAAVSGRTLEDVADDLWTGLGVIRATLPVSQLTIFLCVPNASVLDPDRTEAWFEGIRKIWINAARKFQCVLIDIYGFMRDNRTTSDWADSIDNGDGDVGHIHPDAFGRAMIRTLFAEALFPRGLTSTIGINRVWNVSGAEPGYEQPLVTSPPSFFPYGEVSGRPSGAGWPIDGKLTTTRQADNVVHQQITSYYQPYMVKYERTNTATGPNLNLLMDWTPWVNTVGPAPSVDITYENGWTTFFADYGQARCTKDAAGRVLIEGTIKEGVVTEDTLVGILPEGFRPAKKHIFSQPTDAAGRATIQIYENGQIWGTNGLNASWTSLDGIVFTAAF